MKLNNICNRIAARILGVPGTLVRHVHNEKIYGEFKVLGFKGGHLDIAGDRLVVGGFYTATLFRKMLSTDSD